MAAAAVASGEVGRTVNYRVAHGSRRLNIERRPGNDSPVRVAVAARVAAAEAPSRAVAGRLLRRRSFPVHFHPSRRIISTSRRPDAGNPVLIRRRRQSRRRAAGAGVPCSAVAPPGRRPHSAAVIGEPLSSCDSRSTGRPASLHV